MATAPVRVRVPLRIDFAGGWSDVPDFAAREGGAVFNAAIDRCVEGCACWDDTGLRLSYRLDLPPDCHLGSSSAIDLAWLRLTLGLIGRTAAPEALAEKVYALEGLLAEKGGKQDQYAAALGGFHLLRFAGADVPATIERVALPDDTVAALEARSLLVFTGPSRGSGDLHRDVWRRFHAGDRRVADTLRSLRDSAEPARNALVAGDFAEFGRILTLNREAAGRLHKDVVSDAMARFFAIAERNGGLGGKPCGAGGGGCIFILCEPDNRVTISDDIATAGGTVLPFAYEPSNA